MLDLIVWLIIFLIICGIILVVCYWVHLFQTRDSYEREELIDFYTIITNELSRLTDSWGSPASFLAMGLGILVAWFLTLFGGWISPPAAGVPDYASNLATNYFFQSILFIGILHLMWPSFRDYAYDTSGTDSFFAELVSKEVPFFFTLGSSLAAVSLMTWGVYHKMSFVFCLANAISTALYAGFRVYHYDPQSSDAEIYDTYPESESTEEYSYSDDYQDDTDEVDDIEDYSVYDQNLDDAPKI